MKKYYTVMDMKENKVITTAVQNTTLENIMTCTYKYRKIIGMQATENAMILESENGIVRTIRETTQDDMNELVGCC